MPVCVASSCPLPLLSSFLLLFSLLCSFLTFFPVCLLVLVFLFAFFFPFFPFLSVSCGSHLSRTSSQSKHKESSKHCIFTQETLRREHEAKDSALQEIESQRSAVKHAEAQWEDEKQHVNQLKDGLIAIRKQHQSFQIQLTDANTNYASALTRIQTLLMQITRLKLALQKEQHKGSSMIQAAYATCDHLRAQLNAKLDEVTKEINVLTKEKDELQKNPYLDSNHLMKERSVDDDDDEEEEEEDNDDVLHTEERSESGCVADAFDRDFCEMRDLIDHDEYVL